jgi:hypothetical protein
MEDTMGTDQQGSISDATSEVTNLNINSSEVTNLNIDSLDVEELERRLELATADPEAWVCIGVNKEN